MPKNNFNDIPYAEWLENALKELLELPVKGICMAAIVGDKGDIYTNYHNVAMADKLVIAGLIQQDAMIDTMVANGMVQEEGEDGTEEE
jgi:hypothetical protein